MFVEDIAFRYVLSGRIMLVLYVLFRQFYFYHCLSALLVSNCALNMACEILQLELGNMNLRLFGSPGKFYGQARAHETIGLDK
ncbi:hypothetical protein Syun_013028 [Stephania yunnanensis]|uniref:Uncharacterized protein n=1 Tax=Stephania yunnanensis TaxID=152371 RepID=A0AAP0K1Z2_9MAGN